MRTLRTANQRGQLEIAKQWQEFDLEDICEVVIDRAYNAGIRVVDKLDPEEYGKFLKDRAEIVKRELAQIQAAKEAKLLRG